MINGFWLFFVRRNFMLEKKRLLLIDFVASTATDHSANKALERKDKKSLPIPVRLLTIRSTCMSNLLSMLFSFAAGDTVQQRSISPSPPPQFQLSFKTCFFDFFFSLISCTPSKYKIFLLFIWLFQTNTSEKSVARITIHHYSTG